MSRNARVIYLYKFGSEHCGEKRSVSEAPSGPERRRGAPDAALRMVGRAVAAGDPYFRAPVISERTGFIFPAFLESKVRRVANGVVAIETDEYYKAVESVGLAQDGNFFVLAITTTVNNKGITLARFFIQKATKEVARMCYEIFFKEVLRINPDWAPWHVLIVRQLSVVAPDTDGAPSEAIVRQATDTVQRMKRGVLVGVTMVFSASLAGGLCDALENVGFEEFDADGHARNILFGCQAHANRVCDRAPLPVRDLMRQLMECHNINEAERLRALVIQCEPTRDCSGVLANKRLLPAFCPAFSSAYNLQREAASSTTNAEESQHERVYKLCGRRQPLMVAMTGCSFVDTRDANEVESGRGAGEYTSMERADHSQRRREQRRRARQPHDDDESAEDVVADGEGGVEALNNRATGDHEGGAGGAGSSAGGSRAGGVGSCARLAPAAAQGRKRRRTAKAAPPSASAADMRIAQLEKLLLEQRNKTLEAENGALRSGTGAGLAGAVSAGATAAGPVAAQIGSAPPAWFINIMAAASQVSTQGAALEADGGHGP